MVRCKDNNRQGNLTTLRSARLIPDSAQDVWLVKVNYVEVSIISG